METDKASVSFDATDEGYLAKILAGSGEIKVPRMIFDWPAAITLTAVRRADNGYCGRPFSRARIRQFQPR